MIFNVFMIVLNALGAVAWVINIRDEIAQGDNKSFAPLLAMFSCLFANIILAAFSFFKLIH